MKGFEPSYVASVRDRRPVDDRERESQAACLRRLDHLAAPFDRDADPVHVTGLGIITGPGGVLLLEHRRLHIWVQPGGHLEPGETPWEAARPESEEETGLRLTWAEVSSAAPPAGARGCPPQRRRPHPSRSPLRLDRRGRRPAAPAGGGEPGGAVVSWPEAIATADPGLAGLLRHLAGAGPRPAGAVTLGSVLAQRVDAL